MLTLKLCPGEKETVIVNLIQFQSRRGFQSGELRIKSGDPGAKVIDILRPEVKISRRPEVLTKDKENAEETTAFPVVLAAAAGAAAAIAVGDATTCFSSPIIQMTTKNNYP